MGENRAVLMCSYFERGRLNVRINYNGHRSKEVALVPIKLMDGLSKVVLFFCMERGKYQITRSLCSAFALPDNKSGGRGGYQS